VNPEQFFDALADVPNLRAASFEDIEIKDGGNVFLFDGYAAVYNQPADLGEFSEEVAAGAFRSVLEDGPNVPMLHEHHPHQLLATTRSGRLRLEDDERGLRVRAKLVKTDLSARVKALVDSGDITGMSYGFVAGRGNQKIEARGGRPHRLLTGFKKLLDVSTTWNPAFPTTEAQFRAKAMEFADSPESWQRILMGAYPQLGDMGDDDGGTEDEPREERTDTDAHPRVDEPRQRLEAAKRRLSFITLTTGGLDDAS
jgi:HK97 family phage prohead protease